MTDGYDQMTRDVQSVVDLAHTLREKELVNKELVDSYRAVLTSWEGLHQVKLSRLPAVSSLVVLLYERIDRFKAVADSLMPQDAQAGTSLSADSQA